MDEIESNLTIPKLMHSNELINYNSSVIQYTPDLDITELNPCVGNIFRIYIDQSYFTHDYVTKTNQQSYDDPEYQIFGSNFYSPTSNLVAITIHTGCLFLNPKIRTHKAKRFCSIQNVYEATSVPDQDYYKFAKIVEYPLDLLIQGIIIHVYIDDSPEYYLRTERNGIRSQEKGTPDRFCVRIIDSTLITMYDEIPPFVSPNEYSPSFAVAPKYSFAETGELGIAFDPRLFVQILSRNNVSKGMFRVFKLFFEVGKIKYEISYLGKMKFNVIVDSIDEESIRSIIVPKADITDFFVRKNSIGVLEHVFTPVVKIYLVNSRGGKFKLSS